MTPRQQFKSAFLKAAADDGLTPAEAAALAEDLEKSADGENGPAGWFTGVPGAGMDLGAKALGYAGKGLLLAGGIGALGGAAIGGSVAKLQERHVEPEEARKQETIAAYNSFAEQLRREHQLRHRPSKNVRTFSAY